MKKLISLLLSACLALGLCIPAYATTITSSGSTGSVPVKLTTIGDYNDDTGTGSGGSHRLNFKVQLPTSLPAYVDSNNVMHTAGNTYISNLSAGAVEVTNVTLEAANGWKVADYGSNMTSSRVNTKTFSMSINGLPSRANTTGHIVYNQDLFMKEFAKNSGTNYLWAATYGRNPTTGRYGTIPSTYGSVHIDYDVAVVAQNQDLSDNTIANVLFTVGFAYSR